MGIGSRRQCEELIAQGRVSVDGKTVSEQGLTVDPRRQRVKVDGQLLKLPPPAYYLLWKPRGVVCSMSEEERGPRAVDFAPKRAGRLHTIGRLDKESEGLIILTNDGELTERLTHPRHDFPKTYRVVVKGNIGSEALQKLRKGVWLAEGKTTVGSVKIIRHVPGASTLEVELREGKNREVRRIFAKVGYPVRDLRRIAIGPIGIGGLKPGAVRPLGADELEMLREAVGTGFGPQASGLREGKQGRGGRAGPQRSRPREAARGAPDRARAHGPAPSPKPEARSPKPAQAPQPPRYVPDADGVIVVRRPSARFSEEE